MLMRAVISSPPKNHTEVPGMTDLGTLNYTRNLLLGSASEQTGPVQLTLVAARTEERVKGDLCAALTYRLIV